LKDIYVIDNEDKYALLYAAIFSDPITYNCQVKRLMKRAGELARLYEQKSEFLSQVCNMKCGTGK